MTSAALIGKLADQEARPEAARLLALAVGAEDAIVFVSDADLGVLLPALGFVQTLRGAAWRELIERARADGRASAVVTVRAEEQRATAVSAPDGSVLVVVGGTPDLAAVAEAAAWLPVVTPLMRLERAARRAQRTADAATVAARRATLLSERLDAAQRELQRVLRESEAAHARAAFLAEASAILSSTLNVERVLSQVAQLTVEGFADVCAIDVRPRAGSDPPTMLVASAPRADDLPIGALRALGALAITEDGSGTALDAEHRAHLGAAGLARAISVPLVARGARAGVLVVGMQGSDRQFGPDDVMLFEELGRRIAMALEAARLYSESQQAVRAREAFLSIASHELRTPLTSLMLQLQSTARRAKREGMPAFVDDGLASAYRQTRRLDKLIENLLDVSRLQSGQIDLEREDADLVALVRDVVAALAEQSLRARCTVVVEAEGPLPGRWDRVRVEQIITNLVGNALKYAPGAPIHIVLERHEGRAVAHVRDQGPGISNANQSRIFRAFERAVAPGTVEGLGLGLFIAHELAAAHGGSLAVASTDGAGATFTVSLPIEA